MFLRLYLVFTTTNAVSESLVSTIRFIKNCLRSKAQINYTTWRSQICFLEEIAKDVFAVFSKEDLKFP